MSDPKRSLEEAIGRLETDFERIRAEEDRWQLPTYTKYPIALVDGKGSHVTDSTGRRYLDLYGGHAVTLLGHGHPRLVAAIRAQAERLLFYSNAVYNDVRALAVGLLTGLAPEGLRRVFLCNSGTEANETALKLARKLTGRKRVVSLSEGFHGRTLGALAATGLPGYRDPAYPLPSEHVFVPHGDVDALDAAVGDDVAAVIVEPIPSMGGVRVGRPDWFETLRSLTRERGALLVFDEVQTGFGRTGTPFFGEQVGVVPDLITGAKGIAGGFPAGCVFLREDLGRRVKPGEQGTTFGGGPLACAAIAATARVLVEERLWENARRVGAALEGALVSLPGVERVQGRGLLLGIDLDRPAKPVVSALLGEGFIVGSSGTANQMRLLPPLTLDAAEAATFPPVLGRLLAARPASA